jgi:hypothetical protein
MTLLSGQQRNAPTTFDESDGLWCDEVFVEIAESGDVVAHVLVFMIPQSTHAFASPFPFLW